MHDLSVRCGYLHSYSHGQVQSETKVSTVAFKDLSANAFQVTMNRVQQDALKQAKSKAPRPTDQLAMVNARRIKKTETTPII